MTHGTGHTKKAGDPSAFSGLMSGTLVAVALLELAARASGNHAIQTATWIAMAMVIVLAWRKLGLRESYLLAASAILSALLWTTHPEAVEVLVSALDQASFLMAFILLLGMLQAAAATSPSVSVLGEYLTRQPPGRRYYALNGGTASLAVLFNVGVISFLVPLIMKGIQRASPGDAWNPIRERRQLSALLRGFAWSVTWSPTAFAPLIVADLIPGVERTAWIGYGFVIFVVLMILGGLEDRWRFRGYKSSGKREVMAFPTGAGLRFTATTLWFLSIVLIVVWGFGDTPIFGVLTACPIIALGWIAAQNGFPKPGTVQKIRTRVSEILVNDIQGSVNVAVTLACSGYVGRAAAGLVPAADVATFLGLNAMQDWLLLALVPIAIALFSLLALSPTMMAVFMGSFFAALPVLPADPTLIAFSISCGWALSMTFSPLATVVLLIDRASGIPAKTLTWGWNLGFTAISAAILFPAFWLLLGGK